MQYKIAKFLHIQMSVLWADENTSIGGGYKVEVLITKSRENVVNCVDIPGCLSPIWTS